MEKQKGYYFGTEVNRVWWKRYCRRPFFMRGNGEYWFDEGGLFFLRYLTKTPLFIPFEFMRSVRFGTSHSGKWVLKEVVVKIDWQKEGLDLSSGFIFGDRQAMLTVKEMLEKKITQERDMEAPTPGSQDDRNGL